MRENLLVFPILVNFSNRPKPVTKQLVVNFSLFQGWWGGGAGGGVVILNDVYTLQKTPMLSKSF